ncbi:MAG: 6-phosphogluconolactonase [Sulfitobacter sp.]
MIFKEYIDQDMASIGLANQLAGNLENALLTHGTASLAVPGGTTPGPVFDSLCAADLDWANVQVFLTDERWVPEGDAQSNAALIRKRLLTSRAATAQFLPFYDAARPLPQAAEALSERLAAHLPISALLLGMGEDMHTASLFPGAADLAAGLAEDAPALVPVTSQATPRISLSAQVLEGALAKHLVIFGDAKRAALERAQELTPQEAPIAAVLSDITVHWAP